MSREREGFEEADEIGKRIKREIDASAAAAAAIGKAGGIPISSYRDNLRHHTQIQMGRRHMLGPPPAVGSTLNTITPCAACKLLRRRCAEECPFSPYFSPHEPHKFAAVHKVFGASNVSKMLMEVPESQRADAANSLVYEANVRLRDPIYGCMGAISALQQQVQTLQAELNAVRAEILKYKYREAANTLISATAAACNTNNSSHPNSLTATAGAVTAVAQQAQVQSPQPQQSAPPPATPPPPPSTSVPVVPTSPHAAASSLYTSPGSASTPGFTSISTSVPYFD